jgi:hypothetical protein
MRILALWNKESLIGSYIPNLLEMQRGQER